ncbi:MAG: hypothetical protein P4L50_11275 [Anaerolineaceae bacterium]|nr:hypothetical protein [Anaerolineaceae bacterium]
MQQNLSQGYALERVPGRGLSNIWTITKDGKSQRASIRTTRDRWFAFPPLAKGTKWKTLSEVDVVIVASVDSRDNPENVEVFIFPAEEVRKRFDAAYTARKKAGKAPTDNFGMWIGLDPDKRSHHDAVSSGIIEKYKRVALYSIDKLIAETSQNLVEQTPGEGSGETDETGEPTPRFTTIAEVMAWARERVAELAGVKAEAIKLDLKVEY